MSGKRSSRFWSPAGDFARPPQNRRELFLAFSLAFRFGGQAVGEGFVAADGAGVLARPFAVGDGVLQAVPGSDFRFSADDATAFLSPAELPFLLAGDRQIRKFVNDFLAGVLDCFFLLTFFHN